MRRRTFLSLLLAVPAVFSVSPAKASGQTIVLGVLEDVPGVYAGEPNSPAVRVVFQKNGPGWQPFPSDCRNQDCLKTISSQYPREVAWTITFAGLSLGRVRGRTPKEFKFYSHIGLQEIVDAGSVPTIGKRSAEFGGFAEASVHRPLVANSQAYFSDPETWKPSVLPADLIGFLREQFRRRFPKFCKASNHDGGKLEPFPYRDEDVKVVKAYTSRKGWTVARLRLEEAIDCDDVEAGFEIGDRWFAVDPQKTAQYLGEGMWLVDAGDYDNDGKSEVVFSIDRYNRGGYELFWDDFKGHATFEFSYH